MTHFPVIATGVDVSPILAEIDAHPELWDQFTMRKSIAGGVHAEMSDIWLRYNAWDNYKGDHQVFGQPHTPVWYPAIAHLPATQRLIYSLAHNLGGVTEIGGCLITRIPPGGRIAPHVDRGWHASHFDTKVYVQLRSQHGADFCCHHPQLPGSEVERFNPRPGDVHTFNNQKLHWVDNDSIGDRMTLIACFRTGRGDQP